MSAIPFQSHVVNYILGTYVGEIHPELVFNRKPIVFTEVRAWKNKMKDGVGNNQQRF